MPHSRFFLNESFAKNMELTLQDEEFHHLQVMRKKVDQIVEITNGKNQLAFSKIIKINQKSATVQIIEIFEETPPTPHIILAQAMVRPAKLDFIFEKCTEIGVFEFILYKAENSEMEELSENKIQRINSIIISAIKQCGRLDLPKVSFFDDLNMFKKLDYNYLFGSINSHILLDINTLKGSPKPICIFIGPEQGFTEQEESFFSTQLNATAVKINKNILRTETAAISSATLLTQLHILH